MSRMKTRSMSSPRARPDPDGNSDISTSTCASPSIPNMNPSTGIDAVYESNTPNRRKRGRSTSGERPHKYHKPSSAPDENNDIGTSTVAGSSTPKSKSSTALEDVHEASNRTRRERRLTTFGEYPSRKPAPAPKNDVSTSTVASPSTPNSNPSDRSPSGERPQNWPKAAPAPDTNSDVGISTLANPSTPTKPSAAFVAVSESNIPSTSGERPHFLPKPAPAPDPNNDVRIFTVASPSTPNSKPSDRSTSAYTTMANIHEEHDDEADIQASDVVKANLSTVPADIVYEICGWGTPGDMLSLARTCKYVRDILMSRSSVSIWKTSRQQVSPPIPDPPACVSEPLWASLAYDELCSNCGRTTRENPCWAFLSRLCAKCRRTCLVAQEDYGLKGDPTDDSVWELTVHTRQISASRTMMLVKEQDLYRPEELDKISAPLFRYTKDVIMRERGSKRALEQFISERRKAVEPLNEMDDRMRKWFMKFHELRYARLKTIQSHFEGEGFHHWEFLTDEFQDIDCVKSAEPLTDEEWYSIRLKLSTHLINARYHREAAEAQARKIFEAKNR